MSLKTDYQDAELSPSMGGKRRYNQIENADGTFSLEDRTAYTRLGDNFGAEDINATNREVNELNDSLNNFSFRVDNGKKQVSTNGGTTWENFNKGVELLWTNPTPTSALSSLNIPLNLEDYIGIIVVTYYSTTNRTTNTIQFLPKGVGKLANNLYGLTNGGKDYYRDINISNTGITIGVCKHPEYPTILDIPYKIYGVNGDITIG